MDPVARGNAAHELEEATGQVPRIEGRPTFRLDGNDVPFDEGQSIEKGAVLARMKTDLLQAQLNAAEAARVTAEAKLIDLRRSRLRANACRVSPPPQPRAKAYRR